MKRAENKASNKFSLIHLEEANHLTRLKKQLEQVQPSKKLNMNQVKKKKTT